MLDTCIPVKPSKVDGRVYLYSYFDDILQVCFSVISRNYFKINVSSLIQVPRVCELFINLQQTIQEVVAEINTYLKRYDNIFQLNMFVC